VTAVPQRKLIEVALPLEAINRACQHEKSVPRKGQPATMHLWWTRRPLAACRAVLFAQLVDDPSSHPDRFPTDDDQAAERQRLFELMEQFVQWENASDESLLRQARAEIASSFPDGLPTVLDPFSGGGSNSVGGTAARTQSSRKRLEPGTRADQQGVVSIHGGGLTWVVVDTPGAGS